MIPPKAVKLTQVDAEDYEGMPPKALLVVGDVPGGGGEAVTWATISGKPAVIAAGADAAAARTAIGAGTSSLALGTTASTAKAGNYTPTSTEVGNALKAKSQIAALVADLVPAEATSEECATKINEIIAALKA